MDKPRVVGAIPLRGSPTFTVTRHHLELIFVKRRTVIALAVPGAVALSGFSPWLHSEPAAAASRYPLPVGTATVFNTIRENEILNRPTDFVFHGRKVRNIRVTGRNRGEKSTNQNRDTFRFRAKWQVMNDVDITLVSEVGNFWTAKGIAQRHLDAISRIPFIFRRHINRIDIFDGQGTCRGGRGGIYVYADAKPDFQAFQGMIFHEVLHSVYHALPSARREEWLAAQEADRKVAPRFDGFVSQYARDNPNTEDFTSAVVPWFSLRNHPGRLTAEQRLFIREQMPNRIKFLNRHYSQAVVF